MSVIESIPGEHEAHNVSHLELVGRGREVCFGDNELEAVKLGELVSLSQQRGSANPAFEEIKASVRRDGLINNPDIALLDPKDFENYIDFVNRIWKSGHRIENYVPGADGMYRLVIAGHTRIDAIRSICEDDDMNPNDTRIKCKVRIGLKPRDILAIQMSENIHEKPSPERAAIALVETYYYGIEAGEWSNKQGFLDANSGKFSRGTLSNAIYFADLPEMARDLVFAGAVSYSSVIEIARVVKNYESFVLYKHFGGRDVNDLSSEERDRFEEVVKQWCCSEVAHVQAHGLAATRCRGRYKGYVESWEKTILGEAEQGSLFSDPDEEWDRHIRAIRHSFEASVRALSGKKADQLASHTAMYMNILGEASPETERLLEGIAVASSGIAALGGLL
ncbi:hypothetical protein KA068_00750 [Candidatus Saccharibacteria bacterium]|nr:hypothetical protein [Candidatus Saccharibacteria bacterium]